MHHQHLAQCALGVSRGSSEERILEHELDAACERARAAVGPAQSAPSISIAPDVGASSRRAGVRASTCRSRSRRRRRACAGLELERDAADGAHRGVAAPSARTARRGRSRAQHRLTHVSGSFQHARPGRARARAAAAPRRRSARRPRRSGNGRGSRRRVGGVGRRSPICRSGARWPVAGPGSEPSSAAVYGMLRLARRCRRRRRCSTIRPAYMTATRSTSRATTPRSCVTQTTAMPVSRCRLSTSSRICCWIVTSSAVVGSSAIEHARRRRQRHRDHDALEHAARELVRERVRDPLGIGEPDVAEHAPGCAPACVPVRPVRAQRLDDLGADAQQRVQRAHRVLVDHRHPAAADLPQAPRRHAAQVLTVEADAVRRGSRAARAAGCSSERTVSVLPEPLSPTMPSFSPGATSRSTPRTISEVSPRRRRPTRRSRIERSSLTGRRLRASRGGQRRAHDESHG